MDSLLTQDTTSATALFLAVRNLLGPQFINWEPESIWMDLYQKHGIDLSNINRDKIQACITLLTTDYFYHDAAVFENTCMAFCHEWSSPEILHEASPAQMSWGVVEAKFLRKLHNQESLPFDYEPRGYVAIVCYREGLVVAPSYLSFAQEEIAKRFLNSKELRREVLAQWEVITRTRTPLESLELTETPVHAQLAKLVAIELYVRDRTNEVLKQLPLVS